MPHTHSDVDTVLEKFRANGGRVTTARREIVSVVLGGTEHEHLTADEIGRRIQDEHPEIALSTVYRSLDALAEAGSVTSLSGEKLMIDDGEDELTINGAKVVCGPIQVNNATIYIVDQVSWRA